MKKILFFLVFILFWMGCAKWEILSPTNGELTVSLLGVETTFDFNNQKIIAFNKNWEYARDRVSRRETWNEYLVIFDQRVRGRSEVEEAAYFDHGDKIKIWIQIKDDQDNDAWRETYFGLGKRAVSASEFFLDWEPESWELGLEDDGRIFLEFTL
ncbi:hypothetical protein ISS21_02275 [Patescibacteria group bacterium]|nr:hypothetical protein [Patescibacteria group bacterium]